jgi:hypothetical protein
MYMKEERSAANVLEGLATQLMEAAGSPEMLFCV